MSAQYDKLVEAFPLAETMIFRPHIEQYTIFKVLGDIQGRSILDVACGDGLYSRFFRQRGASRVVGVDISTESIEAAKEREAKEQLGIEYHTYDAAELPVLAAFDIVNASYLLHYASSEDVMRRMCRSMFANLRRGGRLVTIAVNPDFDPRGPNATKYGLSMRIKEPLSEGDPISADIHVEPMFSIHFYHWSRATHERALTEAGFRNIVWHRPECSPEGLERFERGFWDDYLNNPHAIVVSCDKA